MVRHQAGVTPAGKSFPCGCGTAGLPSVQELGRNSGEPEAQLATDGVQASNLGCAHVGRPVSSCALSGRLSLSARWPGPPVGPGRG